MIDKIKNFYIPIKIIIFGASITGKFTLEICQKNNIEIECFCDNNPDKIKNLFCGLKVKSLEEIKIEYEHNNILFLISVTDINDIVIQLKKYNFNYWLSCNEILKNIYHPIVSNMILSHDNYLNKDKLFLRGVDVIITEKCSLKCRDCSNLMNYYENPKNCDTETINQEILNLCNKVDKIGELRIIGGEPFMNREIHLIIKPLLTNDKINQIVIYTNGTILPSNEQLEILKHQKIYFYISNYGELSKNFYNLYNLLLKENISFITANIKWTDCSKIYENNRNDIENQKIFNDCCVKNLFTLSNNKLYRCPFFANAHRLKAIPDFYNEYVDLSLDISKEKIKKYILNRKYLKVCDFCNGRSFNDKEIDFAVQIEKPIPYKKFK